MIRILFAPDWQNGVPYQRLLAEALRAQGVEVDFLQGYKRIFPLRRLLAGHPCDILHLHWPEAYYPRKGDAWDWFRRARFTYDLRSAARGRALAVTAHNLHAHNRAHEPFAHRNTKCAHATASVVFAHSSVAKERLAETFGVTREKVRVIPHGDLSVTLGTPLPQAEARQQLSIGPAPLALMFGAVEPYKGQEEVLAWWRMNRPAATLAIVGNPITPEYGSHISGLCRDAIGVQTDFAWLPDDKLRLWLSAADVVIFNYRQIFTSGAANLARSWGLPMLLPARLNTVVLDEPSPFIHRFHDFETSFPNALSEALKVRPDFASAQSWRNACGWDVVARLTADGYRYALRR